MRGSSFLLAALPLLAACGDIEVRRIVIGETLPAGLAGEWSGSWQSSETGATGQLRVAVQQFRGEPLVQLVLDNPCLQPGDYALSLRNGTIELAKDGLTVLSASLAGERAMTGSYRCVEDRGSLTASWQRDLPAPLDLSGSWQGNLTVFGQAPIAIDLQLEQRVRTASLQLDGVLTVPSLSLAIPVEGHVIFRDIGFDLRLVSRDGAEPRLELSGFGDREPIQVETGLVRFPDLAPPFAQAVVQIARTP